MSSYNYNPVPPRVWSRVQNPCTYTVPGSDYTQAFIPLTGETVSQAQADYQIKQINKGNILQYKGNSARLTKSQKYSQLARCAGPNRTKVFATQSETYTNPNTTGLLRVGTQTYPYPNQIVGAPNNISGPFEYNIQNPNDCSGNSVQDGGILVCGTYANPCSGEIIRQGRTNATICNPASASNVPGTSVLCWNNKIQTWFPKPRYFMNNSTDKWPQGYKGFVSAVKPYPPILNLDNIIDNNVFLSWKYENNNCIPISSFHLYQIVNNVTNLIKIIPFPISSTEVSNLINCAFYNFYITAVSTNVESDKSNEVSVFIRVLYPTTITSITASCESATLSWIDPNIPCINITEYYVYQDGTKIATLAPNVFTYTATGLTTCTDYNYNISYFDSISNKESDLSNTATITEKPCPPTINSITFDYTTNSQNISFNAPIATCVFNYYNLYQIITPTDLYTPIAIPGIYPGNYNLTAGNLQINPSQGEHTFYMTSFSNTNMTESSNSNEFSIPPPPTNLTGNLTSISGQVQLYWNNQAPTTGLTITQNKVYAYNTTTLTYTSNLIIPSSNYLLFGLTPGDTYDIYVTSLVSSNSTESIFSNTFSITIPPLIDITAVGYNTDLSNFSKNSSEGVIIFTSSGSSGSFTINSFNSDEITIHIFAVSGGGNGGGGGNTNGGVAFGGGGGGGGGGGYFTLTASNIPIIGSYITTGTYSITVGSAATNSKVYNNSNLITIMEPSPGITGENGESSSGGIANGGGANILGNGIGGPGGNSSDSGQEGTPGTPNPFYFTVNGFTYYIYCGGGGGGGSGGGASGSGKSGGAPGGGVGGAGQNSGIRTGQPAVYQIANINSIYIGGGGGGGSGANPEGNSGYNGGAGAPGIVGIYWK